MADALASGASEGNLVGVQVPPRPLDSTVSTTTLRVRSHRCTIWYMNVDASIEIDAPPAVVWDVFTHVEGWPTFTASVTRLRALDGSAIEVGKRFEIKQPRMPKLVWEITEVDPGHSWTWRQRSAGSTTYATHWVEPAVDGATLVKQRIEQRGPI